MMLWYSQRRQGHAGVLSKRGQESVLCHSPTCLWHICGQSLRCQLNTSHVFFRGVTPHREESGSIIALLVETSLLIPPLPHS